MIRESVPLNNVGGVGTLEMYIQKENKTNLGILICPGGGYVHISESEGRPVAMKLFEQGYNVFILKYSCGENAMIQESGIENFTPFKELEYSIKYIEKQFGFDLIYMGFSAGGHLASAVSFLSTAPKLLVLSYPLLSFTMVKQQTMLKGENYNIKDIVERTIFKDVKISKSLLEKYDILEIVKKSKTKPFKTFLWHSTDDTIVPIEGSRILKNILGDAIDFLEVPHAIHGAPFSNMEWIEKLNTILEEHRK